MLDRNYYPLVRNYCLWVSPLWMRLLTVDSWRFLGVPDPSGGGYYIASLRNQRMVVCRGLISISVW